MNSYGRIFRIHIFGESHGPDVGVLIDGCPAGLPLKAADFALDLGRRRGEGKGVTARAESDEPQIKSGVFSDRTTGAPILILLENSDIRPGDYEKLIHTPRPGHADLTARQKFGGFNDARGGGHFSGRLTAAMAAAGVVAKKLVQPVAVKAWLKEAGGERDIGGAVAEAVKEKDSIGGIIECVAEGVPAGLGEPFFDSLESRIAHMIFSIPGIKGIEFGAGFAAARMRGSEHNDAILDAEGRTETNHAGGINGGISNGNPISFRTVVKPTPSIGKSQRTVDLKTGKQTSIEIGGRHDICIALRAPVVVEAATAVVLADLLLLEQRIPRVLP
jgi:chorismate synthase